MVSVSGDPNMSFVPISHLLYFTRSMVFSRTGFLYLAVTRQGTIVYNLPIYPYMPLVIYRVLLQLAFGVALVHRL